MSADLTESDITSCDVRILRLPLRPTIATLVLLKYPKEETKIPVRKKSRRIYSVSRKVKSLSTDGIYVRTTTTTIQ